MKKILCVIMSLLLVLAMASPAAAVNAEKQIDKVIEKQKIIIQ